MTDPGIAVRLPRADRLVAWIGFPLAGAVAGLLVCFAAAWAAELPVPVLHGLLVFLAKLAPPVAAGGGVILGFGLAAATAADELVATVGRSSVTLARGSRRAEVARGGVAGVLVSGRELVLLAADGREPARERIERSQAGPLREAFTGQGWPWLEADPHAGEFRLWVPGLPDLPPGGDALLTARGKLDPGRRGDREELRRELARVGVVVRDEGRKQYVRVVRLS